MSCWRRRPDDFFVTLHPRFAAAVDAFGVQYTRDLMGRRVLWPPYSVISLRESFGCSCRVKLTTWLAREVMGFAAGIGYEGPLFHFGSERAA